MSMNRILWSPSALKDRLFIEGATDAIGNFFIKEQDDKFEIFTPSGDTEKLDTLELAKDRCEELLFNKLADELTRRLG